MSIPDWLGVLTVVVAMPLNWIVTALLWRLSRSAPDVVALRERAGIATALSVIVTAFSIVFINNDMTPPAFDFETTKYVTRTTLFLMATIPALLWLRLWWRVKP